MRNTTIIKGQNVKNTGFSVQAFNETKEVQVIKSLYVSGERISGTQIQKTGKNIDLGNSDNNLRTFAIVAYSAGSQVGLTTTAINVGLTLESNPYQFFIDGKCSLYAVKKVLKGFGSRKTAYGSGQRYESVFKDQLNKIAAINEYGRVNTYIRVSKHEIAEFNNKIKALDVYAVTPQDLIVIGKDIDAIGRAMQELAIDSAKDKTKDIGFSMDSFLFAGAKVYSKEIVKRGLISNLTAIKEEKRSKDIVTAEYKMKSDDIKLLKDMTCDSKDEANSCTIEDLSGVVITEIMDGFNESFANVVKAYNNSSSTMYNEAKSFISSANSTTNDPVLIAEKQKQSSMIKLCRIALNTINGMFKSKTQGIRLDSGYIKEQAFKMRSALYMEGSKLELSGQEIVKLAIAASFSSIAPNGKLRTRTIPSLKALWTIFPREFINDYAVGGEEDMLLIPLTVDYTDFDLMEGDVLYFENGECDTELGYVSVKPTLSGLMYTGSATVTTEGLIADIDIYAYEPVEYVLLDKICEENVALANAPMLSIPNYISYDLDKDQDSIQYAAKNMVNSTIAHAIWNNHLVVKNEGISIIGNILGCSDNFKGKTPNAFIVNDGGFVIYN